MRIAIAQSNLWVGDVAGNVRRLLEMAEKARGSGAELLVTPELALCGYPPEDLLLRRDFLDCCDAGLQDLARRCPLPILVGHPQRHGGALYNAASLLQGGQVVASYHKHCLPNYRVFDELRYFRAGQQAVILPLGSFLLAVLICEDIWCGDDALAASQALGAELVVVLNASPYHRGKQREREELLARQARRTQLPLVYANAVGGQDELVFDGASFAVDATGRVQGRAPQFREDLLLLDIERSAAGTVAVCSSPTPAALPLDDLAEVYGALVLGLRDYVEKNGFPGVVLGLSGGVDSALTLAIAVDALGPERVDALIMPSPYTAPMSIEDAQAEAATLGVRSHLLPIHELFTAYQHSLSETFAGRAADTTEENLQARIRAALLMAFSNKFGPLLLTTGNKSEIAVGYATLYGDMAGGFALIKDCPKTLVYALARYRNHRSPVIPERVLTRAPTAELAPGQTDQDSLPPYPELDAIITAYVEENRSMAEIVAMGHAPATVASVLRLIQMAEYKRRQGAPGVRITPLAFGKDRRYPITNGFRPWTPHCATEEST
ncbi:NAD+ synthase [Acidithiobacillus sp.]|uniref:NAD+ synthase n=1 Tax=Acidithiobacillus sp. TaxID=1872118 RepID=UPI0025C6F3D6|nr:NAD+ synthase [Acidithiobacillus sp.]